MPPEPLHVEQVVEWYLKGGTEQQIRDAIRDTYPQGDVEKYLIEAEFHLIGHANPPPELIRGWCFLAYKRLYSKQIEIGDFSGALRAVKHIQDMARD